MVGKKVPYYGILFKCYRPKTLSHDVSELLLNYVVITHILKERQRDIVFDIPSFCPSNPTKVVGTLCAQLLPKFYADSFEPSHVYLPLSEDVHVVWI